jgi:hypothetical protein
MSGRHSHNSHAKVPGKISWAKVLILSVPLSIALQVTVLVVAALISHAPRIVCTASVEGYRAEPCDFGQLVIETVGMTVLYNGILVGIPTLISYLVSVVALGALYSAFSPAPRRRD